MTRVCRRDQGGDMSEWFQAAVESCDPETHEHPGVGFDYPCWSCRLDAYFAAAMGAEGGTG